MNLKLLTPAQQKVYEAIMLNFVITGSATSIPKLSAAVGLAPSTIHKHVGSLVKAGLLQKSATGRIQKLSADYCPTCGHRKTA